MPPVIQPVHLRHLGVLAGDTKNELTQLVGRQGLEGEGTEGAPGPAGATGPEGKEGPPGKGFVFHEGASSAVWTVVHGLGKYPSVTVQDTAGDEVDGVIVYVSEEELTITFSSAFSGTAYLS